MFQLNLIRRVKCRPIVPMIPRRAAGPVVRSFIMAPGEIMKSPGPGAESPRGPTGESLSAGGTSKKLRYRLRANRNVKCRSAVPARVGTRDCQWERQERNDHGIQVARTGRLRFYGSVLEPAGTGRGVHE